jgi:hypothetical protein
VSLSWPTSPEGLRLWGQILLVWVLASYFVLGNSPIIEQVGAHPARRLGTAWKRRAWARAPLLLLSLVLMMTPHTPALWVLILLLPALTTLLPFARAYLAHRDRRWGAELELGTNALVVLLSAALLGDSRDAGRALIAIPLSASRLAALCLATAILGFLTGGGTHVVRGILTKTDAGPLDPSGPGPVPPVDVAEYNRGRTIGAVERLIMAAMVAAGAFGALTFLIGAKGLIRSKRLEDPAFGEYFLIGTLSSAALAIAFGLLLRAVLAALW